jgi:hypothetical protein
MIHIKFIYVGYFYLVNIIIYKYLDIFTISNIYIYLGNIIINTGKSSKAYFKFQ